MLWSQREREQSLIDWDAYAAKMICASVTRTEARMNFVRLSPGRLRKMAVGTLMAAGFLPQLMAQSTPTLVELNSSESLLVGSWEGDFIVTWPDGEEVPLGERNSEVIELRPDRTVVVHPRCGDHHDRRVAYLQAFRLRWSVTPNNVLRWHSDTAKTDLVGGSVPMVLEGTKLRLPTSAGNDIVLTRYSGPLPPPGCQIQHEATRPEPTRLAAGQSPNYRRTASSAEIIGAWAILPWAGAFYKYRYVEITADGRIGRFVTNTEPTSMNARVLEDVIDGRTKLDGVVNGWNACAISDGRVSETPANGGAELNYVIQMLTSPAGGDQQRTSIPGSPGDLIMREWFKIPADWDPIRGAPEILGPPALVLHALPR